jgi:hypothetical protein
MGDYNIQRSKKTLASVEDRKDYSIILQNIAREAGNEAIVEAKVLKIPITYLNSDNQVVKRFPNGRIEVIEHLTKAKKNNIFPKGTILHSHKVSDYEKAKNNLR